MVNLYMLFLGWSHIIGVVIWIGGALFLDYIVVPSTRNLDGKSALDLNRAIVRRFTPLVWFAAILIGVTGVLRGYSMGVFDPQIITGSSYGMVLQGKMLLYTIMFLVGITITITGRKLAKDVGLEEIRRLARRIGYLSKLNIALGLIAILFAVALRLGV